MEFFFLKQFIQKAEFSLFFMEILLRFIINFHFCTKNRDDKELKKLD